MNPLQKARDGAGSAWRKSRDGTKRTAGWVKGGMTGAFGKVGAGTPKPAAGASKDTSTSPGAARDGIAGAWDRLGGAALMQRARADGRVGAGLILGAILIATWIAWTVYVWTENGSTAGIGVLISWPAALIALALVAAPLVAAVALVRRMAADREPALAGGAVPPNPDPEPEDKESENDESEDEDEDESEAEKSDDANSEDEESGDEESADQESEDEEAA